jgi:hypothetical protein
MPDTPASRAGLKQNDVIRSIDGKNITSPEDLRAAVLAAGVGKEATIKIVRGKERQEVKARLDEAPGGVGFGLPIPPRAGARPPFEGLPPLGEDSQRIQKLERRIEQLEKRLSDLEKKSGQTPGK